MAARSSAVYSRLPLPPGRFLVLISLRGCVDPRTIVRLEGLGKLKKFNDFIRNRTLNLQTCSMMLQLNTLPRAPYRCNVDGFFLNSGLWGYWHCGLSWPIVPASGDSEDDCGEADGMYIGRGNRSYRRKPAPAPLLSITKSHMTRPGFEPGPPRWETGD
jgi:hypothetical protein